MDWEKLKAQINGNIEWILLGLAVLFTLLSMSDRIVVGVAYSTLGMWIAFAIVHAGERLRSAKASEAPQAPQQQDQAPKA